MGETEIEKNGFGVFGIEGHRSQQKNKSQQQYFILCKFAMRYG